MIFGGNQDNKKLHRPPPRCKRKRIIRMARFTNGWVKIHRKLFTDEWMALLNFNSRSLLIHLIAMANIKKSRYSKNGQVHYIEAGSLITSDAELCRMTNLSRNTIRSCIKSLEITDTITVKRDNQGTTITICNYSKYQHTEKEGGTATWTASCTADCTANWTASCTASCTHIEELKNTKNVKKDKNLRSNTAKASEPSSAKKIIELYCEKYKQRFGRYPVITGKEAGAAKNLAKSIAEKDFEKLMAGYFALSDAWIVQRMYPLDVLQGASIINRIMAKDGGVDVSQQKSQEYQKRMEYKTPPIKIP
ncbi:hypothetical protein EB077_08990 [bacterium]|nr:hypothetical protein [bacterium]